MLMVLLESQRFFDGGKTLLAVGHSLWIFQRGDVRIWVDLHDFMHPIW